MLFRKKTVQSRVTVKNPRKLLLKTSSISKDTKYQLTVRWHAVALCVVCIRCVWPRWLQGGAVLSLSIRSHDPSPPSADLRRKNEETVQKFSFSVSVTVKYLFCVFLVGDEEEHKLLVNMQIVFFLCKPK